MKVRENVLFLAMFALLSACRSSPEYSSTDQEQAVAPTDATDRSKQYNKALNKYVDLTAAFVSCSVSYAAKYREGGLTATEMADAALSECDSFVPKIETQAEAAYVYLSADGNLDSAERSARKLRMKSESLARGSVLRYLAEHPLKK